MLTFHLHKCPVVLLHLAAPLPCDDVNPLNLHNPLDTQRLKPWQVAIDHPRWLNDLCLYLQSAYNCEEIVRIDATTQPRAHDLCVAFCCLDEASDETDMLEAVRSAMRHAPVGIVCTRSERKTDLHGWQAELKAAGLHVAFSGRSRQDDDAWLVAIVQLTTARMEAAPNRFRVLAVVPTFNEEDVIGQTLQYLTAQGIEVHLLDNWSTDCTVERARAFLDRGLRTIERFPADRPSDTYDLARIMQRVEEIHAESSWASWVMLHDADERRRGPWPSVGLRDALWYVERCGFSCIDHVTLNFWPTDNEFAPAGADLEEHFHHFEFSTHPGHFHQRRAWRQQRQPVLLTASGGHDVQFAHRCVYPYKFLLKHFPIRSDAHGARKVLQERMPRFNSQERDQGWHQQYDEMPARGFVRSPNTLQRFEAETFASEYLLERLFGINVFERPPPWATPPTW